MVYIGNCTFEHNGPVLVLKPQQYRGHSAGLSIGTREESTNNSGIHFMVTDCIFLNNTSNAPPDSMGATTRLYTAFTFPGRGGGCSILMNTSFPANATIENCIFEENRATNFGGGIYLGFSGYSSHEIVINKMKFVRNRSGSAGGLQYGFLEGVGRGADIVLLLTNTEFVENSARFGGGMHIFATGKWRFMCLLRGIVIVTNLQSLIGYTCWFLSITFDPVVLRVLNGGWGMGRGGLAYCPEMLSRGLGRGDCK